jgi:hypothetical protein
VALWLAGALGSLWAFYLVAMNVFLETGLFRRIVNFSPEELRVDYSRAYSVIPGRIHVDGLSIRGSDSMVQWILVLDRCDFHFWPLDIVRRRFHASHIRGDGLSFRMRLRLPKDDETQKIAGDLPSIAGFTDPPYLLIGPPPAPLTDKDYNLVGIQLDDVVAEHVREIWTQTLRFTGDLRVTGRWLFRPLRWLDVGPATIDVRSMDLSYGPDRPLATSLHGSVGVTLHPFDVRVPEGLEILRYLSTRPELDGVAHVATALQTLAKVPGVSFVRADGPLTVGLLVDHGWVRPGSRMSTSFANAEVDVEGRDVESNGEAALVVENDQGGPVARARLALSAPRVTQETEELARASAVSAAVNWPDVDLAHLSDEGATFTFDARGLSAPSVAPLHAVLLARGYDVQSNRVTADGHLEGRIDDSNAAGELAFDARALSVASKRDRVAANVEGQIRLTAGSLRERRGEFTESGITLRDVVGRARGVEVTAATFAARAARAVVRDGRWSVVLDVDLPRARAGDLRQLNGLLPAGAPMAIRGGRGYVSAHAAVDLDARTFRGEARFSTEALRLRIGSETFGSDFAATLRARPGPKADQTDLSGSSLTFGNADRGEGGPWWARVAAPEASLRLAGGARFFARVKINAKDASPAEALVAGTTAVPRWLIEMAPMRELTGEATIAAAPSFFGIRSLEAHGGSTSLRVEYARRADDKNGAAMVDVGPLHMGFRLAGGGPGFVLFGAQSWFEGKLTAINADPRLAWNAE